jgi:predicted aspartyl protease
VALESRLVEATGHLLVRLQMNGVEGWFLLDTGAGELVILPEFARRAGLGRVGSRSLGSMAGVEQAAVVDAGDISVGSLTISGTAGVVSEGLATLPAVLGTPVDGIIGAHLFSHAVVSMDLVAGTVTIAPVAPAAAWTPVRFQNLHPLVEATFEGRRALFRLDTGAMPGLVFNTAAVRAHSLLEGRATEPVPSDGAALELSIGKLASFEIGGVTLYDVDALFSTGQDTVLSYDITAGLVGIPVLCGFSLIVDLPGRRIALTPRE